MDKEKVKQVKNAVECCSNREIYDCTSCPYRNVSSDCQDNLIYDMGVYINDLEKENEALWKGVKRLKKRYKETITKNADECVKKFCETVMYKEIDKLVNENQQLKESIEYGNEVCKECQSDKDKGKKWQLKRFAERLKEKITTDYINGTREYAIAKIDETLKEFINGKV